MWIRARLQVSITSVAAETPGDFVLIGGDAALQSWSGEVTHGEWRGCPGAWSGSWKGMVYNTPAPRNC